MSSRNTRSVRTRLAHKLAAYAGVAGSATLPSQVDAEVVFTNLSDHSGVLVTRQREDDCWDFSDVTCSFNVDLTLDGTIDFRLTNRSTSFDLDPPRGFSTNVDLTGRAVLPKRFEQNELIGPGSNANSQLAIAHKRVVFNDFDDDPPSFRRYSGAFLDVTTHVNCRTGTYTASGYVCTSQTTTRTAVPQSGYAGLQFKISGKTHFGWLQLKVDSFSSTTVFGFAYETQPDTPILAGDKGQTSSIAGDNNRDGKVDINDLNNVRNNFGGTGTPGSVRGDVFPFDGVVDDSDLSAVRNSFGSGQPSPVPEPPSLLLLAAGAAGLALLRSRRRARTSPVPPGASA